MPAFRRLITLLLAACALGLPGTAAAQDTGGTAAQDTGGTAAPTREEPMLATSHALLTETVAFTGFFAAANAGRPVTVERFDPITGAWTALATTTVGPDGRWSAAWRADVAGRLRTRASLQPRSGAESLTVLAAAGFEASVTVYKPAIASWYGPGFYGRRTACGRKLTRRLHGVAHKTLPCGREVALRHRGETLIVPVVDRGPYVRGRAWDLTSATATALGFVATGRIGAVALR